MPATERTPGSRSRLFAAVVAALVIGHAGSAWADYKSDYADGLDAAKKGQWAEAEAKMRAALAQESTPAARLNLYGRVYVAYAPQYFLGIAAYRRSNSARVMRSPFSKRRTGMGPAGSTGEAAEGVARTTVMPILYQLHYPGDAGPTARSHSPRRRGP